MVVIRTPGGKVISAGGKAIRPGPTPAPGATSQPVAPGQVTQLAAGTPTQTTVGVTYAAPATGTAPITYAGLTQVGSAVAVANGGTFGPTGGTFTGLAAGTAYTLLVKASNSAGSSTTVRSGTVTTTAAATPAPAQTPVNGAILHSFNLLNWSTASSAGFARQGTVFRQGEVPAGSSVQVQRGGAVVSAQFNERRTWPDGSLALAVMHLRDTAIAAGVRQAYNFVLVLGTPFSDTSARTINDVANQSYANYKVKFANITETDDSGTPVALGSGSFVAYFSDHAAIATRIDRTATGPVSNGYAVWGMARDVGINGAGPGVAVDAHLKTIWYVNEWLNADGSVAGHDVAAVVAQDWWSVPGKKRRDYNATLTSGLGVGTPVETYNAVPHMYNSQWITCQNQGGNNRGKRHWIGAACPTLSYEPDRAYWISTGYVPPLNLATPRNPVPSPGDRAGNAVYQPISNQEHRPAIDGTGAYMGRGCVLGNVDCLAFLSQSPADMAAARINAMAGLHVFYHHRSNRQRTRPGEAADTANTPISLIMAGPSATPAYDFTTQGLPVPVHAYADTRNAPADQDGYIPPTGGRVFWDTSYGDGLPNGNSRSDDASHAVNYSYGMALFEGERYHMEATFDLAMNTLHQGVDALHRISAQWFGGSSTDATYDAVAQFGGQERCTAFALMLIGSAVALVPDNHPASGMFKRLNHQQGLWYQDMLPRLTPDLAAAGCHPWAEIQGDVQTPWQTAFNGMCGYFNVRVTGEVGVKLWAEHVAKWSLNQVNGRIYEVRQYRGSNKRSTERQSPSNLYQLLALEIDSPVVSIDAASGILTAKDYARGDGAVLYPATKNYAGSVKPLTTELVLGQKYYTRDSNGMAFRISASPNGPAVTFGQNYSDIHFLQDYPSLDGASGDTTAPNPFGPNADDYPPMHKSVVVEAFRAGHPQATLALLQKAYTFDSSIPASQLRNWATWDYAADGTYTVNTGTNPTPAPTPTPSPMPTGTPANALTMTGATYGASASGFGQQLTGGGGVAPISMQGGDFTLEVWFTGSANSNFHVLVGLWDTSHTNNAWVGIGGASGGLFAAASSPNLQTSTNNINDGARHHLALMSSTATNCVLLLDGIQVGSFGPPNTTPWASIEIAAAGGTSIGAPGWGAIDEVRMSKIARYVTTGFTPPTTPFTSDADTVALYHLDGNGTAS